MSVTENVRAITIALLHTITRTLNGNSGVDYTVVLSLLSEISAHMVEQLVTVKKGIYINEDCARDLLYLEFFE